MAVSAVEARATERDAYIYGFPLVDNYRIQHSYFVDRGGKEFRAPWNEIYNNARVYTPDDRVVQTPNSDTPYRYIGADLRAEPLVLTMPAVEKDRYWSAPVRRSVHLQLRLRRQPRHRQRRRPLSARRTRWNGPTPAGVASVIRSETDFAFVLYRTQLFNPADIEHVKAIQAEVPVQTPVERSSAGPHHPHRRSTFLTPLASDRQRISLAFFGVLNFVLQFCPTHPAETELKSALGDDRCRGRGALEPPLAVAGDALGPRSRHG